MIATIHSTGSVTHSDYDDSSEFDRFDLAEYRRGSSATHDPIRRSLQTADLQILIPRLFQMNLSSLSAYTEIADLANDAELRDFAQVMTRQRLAQCRALSRLAQPVPPPKSNPATCEFRFAWLRALWSLEQDDMIAFAEQAEQAESLLEEAFVIAADMVVDQPVADLLYELAINVCGARERFEELSKLSLEHVA